jgi:hypothetical protein
MNALGLLKLRTFAACTTALYVASLSRIPRILVAFFFIDERPSCR